jgi:hypothetical protein
MRWDNLFDDLESQLEQGLTAEEVDLKAEEERLRLSRLTIRSRILSIHESFDRHAEFTIRMQLRSGDLLDLRPATVGKDWLSGDIRDSTTRNLQCIIPIDAIAAVVLTNDLVRRSVNEPVTETGQSLSGRLGLPFVLRDLCRRRVSVEILTMTTPVTGTIDRVGRDHVDVAVHEHGAPRRDAAVSAYRIVPLREVLLVRL